MKPDQLSILNLVISVLSLIILGYIAFLTLKFTAKPLLKFQVVSGQPELVFGVGQVATLRLKCRNMGRWYARPAATNLSVFINFHPSLEPFRMRYGSTLEIEVHEVRRGKNYSKYMKASGIHLFSGEPEEDVEIEVKMPCDAGRYPCWVAAYSDEGDCGIHAFTIESRA